jgi:hypothetical protein
VHVRACLCGHAWLSPKGLLAKRGLVRLQGACDMPLSASVVTAMHAWQQLQRPPRDGTSIAVTVGIWLSGLLGVWLVLQ